MCKADIVKIFCGEETHSATSEEQVRGVFAKIQMRKSVMRGKVLPVKITNGRKVVEMFVGANRISGWEKNGGGNETPDYIKGVDGVIDVFKLSLAS